MDLYTTDKIYSFGLEPKNEIDFEHWTSQKGVVDYLEHEAKDEYIIIYASLPHTFIYSVFIPNVEINENAIEDLKEWDCDPYSLWGARYSSRIEHSLSGSRSEILSAGEQIVFGRSFEVINNDKSYYELNQKLVHALGIHYVEENDAWCKLDEHGDVVDVFKVLKINDRYPRNQTGIIIYAKREELSKYVSIEDLTLIRMFDFTRYKSDGFFGWGNNCESKEFGNSTSVYGSLSIALGIGSYSRGFQLVDLSAPKEQRAKHFGGIFSDEEYKKYCSYIAYDWKSNTIKKISCNPDCWVNQFTKSNLPYDITPAFFNPEVLLIYKSDREKYKIGDRSISCRDTWHLETFDVNAAGQVHTYLLYLSKLPYKEQLQWKKYNEIPKVLLSERAFITDIKGEWDEIYDPLLSLKQKLRNLYDEGAPWWTLRDEDALDNVQDVYTKSKREWADEILNLDQLLIEGFNKKWLSKKAEDLGCEFNEKDGTLKLLEVILVALDFEERHVKEIMTPFSVVHKLRSIKAHASGTKAKIAQKNALKEHGSFKKHFENICVDCDKSVEIITKVLKK